MMDSSNTAPNSNGAPGKPFTKGDPRINRKGRPKSFDALRELAQQIAHEEARGQDRKPIVIDGHVVTITEAILRKWATSNDTRLQMAFIEVAYGKTPTKTEVSGPNGSGIPIREIRVFLDDE